jgi:hypothetical protein
LMRRPRAALLLVRGLCGRDRFEPVKAMPAIYRSQRRLLSGAFYPALAPFIAGDVHRWPVDRFGRPFPSR